MRSLHAAVVQRSLRRVDRLLCVLWQVKTSMEMNSHDYRLALLIKESKEAEAKEKMKQRVTRVCMCP